jgi:hypothetical protein
MLDSTSSGARPPLHVEHPQRRALLFRGDELIGTAVLAALAKEALGPKGDKA